MKRLATMALATLAALTMAAALASCSPTPAPSGSGKSGGTSGGQTIVEKGFTFNPSSLTVNVGDTVTFTNQDSVAHHVVVGTTDLGEQAAGQSVTWKADANGTYVLKCLIHPSMTGQITVGSGGPTVGTPSNPSSGSSSGY